MSNVRNDRQRSRWRGKVPYEIADTISPIGRQQIADAMAAWTTVAPVSFVARTGESDYIFFHAGDEECFSTSVGHAGGKQRIGCEFPLTPRMVSGSSLAAENQANGGQVDCVFAGADGAIYVMWTVGSGLWSDPVGLTARGTAVPGGPVALHHQGGIGQLDALFVDGNGVVNVMWVNGNDPWQGPVGLTAPGTAPAGAAISLEYQASDQQLDALFVDGNGVVNVMWVNDGGPWQGPVGLTAPSTAVPGSPVALHHQGGIGQLDALFVDGNGVVNVMWVNGNDPWQGPVGLTAPGTAPAGAAISLEYQASDQQLDALFVDGNGVVNVMWVNDGGPWQGPVGLTAPSTAVPGSPVALHHQGGIGQLDALFVDSNGVVNVMWVNGNDPWQGPVGIS